MSWILRDDQAEFERAPWAVRFKIAGKGPHLVIGDGVGQGAVAATTMTIEPRDASLGRAPIGTALPLSDSYIRQNDLIASFAESAPWHFGYQSDFKILDSDIAGMFCVEVWLSVQTSTLESHPQLVLQFRGQKEGEHYGCHQPGLWVHSSAQSAILVYPMDEPDCQMHREHSDLNMHVFGGFMEKGVIRRMRFRMLLSERVQSATVWKQCFQEFLESPLPLAT